jgi:catechol 2,3-dioxygenase-like lactoylglutathione lyase family enzyme
MNRRNLLQATALAATATVSGGRAKAADSPARPQPRGGFVLTPLADSNPLEAKIVAFTTVSPDVDASIIFYRDVIGMSVVDEGTLPGDVSSAPGVGKRGRRYAILDMPGSPRSALVRVLAAPRGAAANRPRPDSGPMDPGLLVMEGSTRDPAESYHRLASAGTPMISPPRYYFFRNTTWGRDVDVMSYAPFGPGGEQMFITANIRGDRGEWAAPGVHSGFANAAITSLDQRPVDAFYEQALGLKRTSQMECYQPNTNELIGAPPDGYFLWGNVGSGVSIEVWEYKAASGTVYPTALDRTGLAMLTIRVNDLAKCRAMCAAAGIQAVGEGALPLAGGTASDGFTLRGAVGELIEVVPA